MTTTINNDKTINARALRFGEILPGFDQVNISIRLDAYIALNNGGKYTVVGTIGRDGVKTHIIEVSYIMVNGEAIRCNLTSFCGAQCTNRGKSGLAIANTDNVTCERCKKKFKL